MEYKRLQYNLDILEKHNEIHTPVFHLTDGKTYEQYLVRELITDCRELLSKIENGTMIELPCKVGTTIYHLYKAGDVITEDKVFNYHFEICSKPCVSFENYYWYGTYKRVDTILVEHFGKWWFLTKAEAEKRLEELQNGRND